MVLAGRVVIPAAVRKALDLRPGDELIMRVEDGELRLSTGRQALARARRMPQARVAGDLRALTRSHGLALADRACLALARVLGAPAMTADRAWSGLEVGIEIRTIR